MPKRSLTLKRVTRKRDIIDYAVYLAYTPQGDLCVPVGGNIIRLRWATDYRRWSFYGPIPSKVKAATE